MAASDGPTVWDLDYRGKEFQDLILDELGILLLTPETTFCPNYDCFARGQVGEGDIGVHSQKDSRYICRECGKSFSAATGTLFYLMRKGADLITLSELIENLITRVKGCASALGGPILFCVDGLASCPKSILKVLREKELREEPARSNAPEAKIGGGANDHG